MGQYTYVKQRRSVFDIYAKKQNNKTLQLSRLSTLSSPFTAALRQRDIQSKNLGLKNNVFLTTQKFRNLLNSRERERERALNMKSKQKLAAARQVGRWMLRGFFLLTKEARLKINMSINKIYFLSNMSARKIRLPESKKYLLQNRKEISRRFFVIRFSLSLSASFFLSVFLQTLNSVFVLSLSISSTELYNCTRRYSWIARSNQLESSYFCLAFLFTFT